MTLEDEDAVGAAAGPIVDARGHRCPVPTLRLRRAMEPASPGTIMTLLADDPMARIDVPHFASAQGHQVLEITADGEVLRIVIRKGAASPPE